MLQKALILTTLFTLILFCNISQAATKIVYGTSEYVLTQTMNQKTIEQLAMEEARKTAAESAGAFIVSKTFVDKNVLKKDEIIVLLRGIAKLVPGSESKRYEIMNKSDNTRKLFYSASFSIDEDEFDRWVAALESKQKNAIEKMDRISNENKSIDKERSEYEKEYNRYMQTLQTHDINLIQNQLKEIDEWMRFTTFLELATKYYYNYDFLLAEINFLEAAKCCEKRPGTNLYLNAPGMYHSAGMSIVVFDPERAMQHAKKSYELYPYYPRSQDALELMGICSWKMHQHENAADYFRKALEVDNDNISTILLLSTLKFCTNDLKESGNLLNIAKDFIDNKLKHNQEKKYLKSIKKHMSLMDLYRNFVDYKKEYRLDFSKFDFVRAGYEEFDKFYFPFEEFCGYQTDSNKTYLVRFYYNVGNDFTLHAVKVLPYENTGEDEKAFWAESKEY